ncbi:TPA: Fe-S cluster assembly protein SufD [Candidatus Woesearchaeota archaeon]|nr:Fe-S cluster assembly protein SufD [Candidatus Woesearchaeota archaeon]HII69401.1 Fe-S cluster assembly protein SufD [Candidatus Woesearchaeota archaeon]
MTKQLSVQQFPKFTERKNEPAWLTAFRKRSYHEMEKAKAPQFRYGQYIDMSIEGMDINRLVTAKETRMQVKTRIPDRRIIATPDLSDARLTLEVQELLSATPAEPDEQHQLYYFNQAFIENALAIMVPEDTAAEEPIEVEYDVREGSSISALFIIAGRNSRSRVVITTSGGEKGAYIANTLRVLAMPCATIEVVGVQNVSREAVAVQTRKALVKKNAELNWIELQAGALHAKLDVRARLMEAGASVETIVLYQAKGRQRQDICTSVVHVAPKTDSYTTTRGVLNDRAKALSRGLVKIEKDAAGSNGYEKQDALMLSDTAEADAIPNLEIHNHDVKCSHGSAVGQIDSEQLFYLTARGLPEEEAKELIIQGYFIPALEKIPDHEIRKRIMLSLNREWNVEPALAAAADVQDETVPSPSPAKKQEKEQHSEGYYKTREEGRAVSDKPAGIGMLKKEAAIDALKSVEDPEIGLDVWTLGLIYDVTIQEGNKVIIKMTFTSPACPYAPQLVAEIKVALAGKGFKDPEFDFVFDPPWQPSEEVRMMLGML